jgi:hypothetical protein
MSEPEKRIRFNEMYFYENLTSLGLFIIYEFPQKISEIDAGVKPLVKKLTPALLIKIKKLED